MTEEVVVTRKGQTTVPVKLRKKYGIYEGTRLLVEDTGKGILLRKVTGTLEIIGSGSKHASVEEMKRLLDRSSPFVKWRQRVFQELEDVLAL
jgi:AbrB family looped-hinge helix DNA binding protein